jgi:hypothetical protein
MRADIPLLDGGFAAGSGSTASDPPQPGTGRPGSGGSSTFDFGAHASMRDVAGRDIHHNYFYADADDRARGPVSVAQLTMARRVYVSTGSDATLRASCARHRIVFLSGRRESGRRSSALRALDVLTGESQDESLVSILGAASGLDGIAGRLADGHGYLLDASAQDWPDTISEAHLNEVSAALEQGSGGCLIVLADAGTVPPQHVVVVEHEPPDPGQVVESHLAASLAGDAEVTEADRDAARVLLDNALEVSAEARAWHEEITTPAAGAARPPVEAAHLAMAVAEWGRRRAAGEPGEPPIRYYRTLRLYRQARILLGRGDQSDSPLRQAYVMATAVLDGLAVGEVTDCARQLVGLLDEAEGGSRKRRIFAETLTHWLSHADMTAPAAGADGASPGETRVVRLPSRELARTIVEVAWLDYDAARVPLRSWLVQLCHHSDPRVRARAAQSLAFISAHDFRSIRAVVLRPWSSDQSRPVEHQAASWLLEAAATADTTNGQVSRQVQDLLRRWSRSGDVYKQAIAVRTYGTTVGMLDPDVAIQGIRISAADPFIRALPELALGELYLCAADPSFRVLPERQLDEGDADRLRKAVLRELLFWTHAFPAMRERVGSALVRVSWVRQAGSEQRSYDLLWRMASRPRTAGIDLADLAELWMIACQQNGSRRVAWRMLGEWARSCHANPEQRDTFVQLIDMFEQTVDRAELRERFSVYRRQWNKYLGQEESA